MSIKQQGGIFGRNPTFNDVDVDGTISVNDVSVDGSLTVDNVTVQDNKVSSSTGSLLLQSENNSSGFTQNDPDATNTLSIGAAGRTGAGITDTVLRLEAMGNISGANRGSHYTLTAAGTSAWGGSELRFGYFSDGVDYGTRMTLTNVGNLSFPSGQGIDFSATSGTGTSELFDDYEEGTWTPTTAGDATGAFSGQWGSYVKVGRCVTVQFQFAVSSNFTSLFIGGLPYSISGGGLSGFMGASSAIAVSIEDFIIEISGIRFLTAPNTTAGTYRGMATYLTA